MQLGTVDVDKLRGVGDKFVGLWKETAGVLTGNERLQRAGEAQQDRASETLKALREEAEAEAKERKADSIGATQEHDSGSGVFAQAKGAVKETAGNVTGNRDWQREGDADQRRGAAEREATQAKTKAKGHEAKAKADEKAQQAAEKSA